ncbi:MAG: DNA replication and repair protein RecF, partial [Alphaproteobacteria bacterium]|nr:DNA replication and repair protein RecF [Alphaproteobacteria bacterium]
MATLSRLTLTNFRCHAHFRHEFSSAPVVIWGANGAGKTSIIEAISLLA